MPEENRERVTIPAVAERAGVSASSICRRWGDVSGLLAKTATQRLDPNRPLRETGALHTDLIAWAREVISHISRPGNIALLKAAAALNHDRDTDCLRNRKPEARTLVLRAQARKESTPTTQQVIAHVIAPIIFRLVFGGDKVSPELADQLVEELFAITSPTPDTRSCSKQS